MIPSNAKLKLWRSDGCALAGHRADVLLLARLHLVAVVVAEQVEEPVDERPAPLLADDLRAEDDVAERARHARRAARRGRRAGTRARRSPRRCRGARASARASRPARRTRSRARRRRSPRPRARAARARAARLVLDRDAAAVRRSRRRSPATLAVPVSSAWRLYASTIRCTSLCRTTSSLPNSTNAMPSIAARISRTWISPDACSRGRSTCVTSPGDDHLRAEPEPRQEHLHLLGRRVLRLVEDDERVVERPAAHERERRDLDRAALHVRRPAGRRRACRRARRRAGAGTGRPSRACRRGGSRAARRPRPPGA